MIFATMPLALCSVNCFTAVPSGILPNSVSAIRLDCSARDWVKTQTNASARILDPDVRRCMGGVWRKCDATQTETPRAERRNGGRGFGGELRPLGTRRAPNSPTRHLWLVTCGKNTHMRKIFVGVIAMVPAGAGVRPDNSQL